MIKFITTERIFSLRFDLNLLNSEFWQNDNELAILYGACNNYSNVLKFNIHIEYNTNKLLSKNMILQTEKSINFNLITALDNLYDYLILNNQKISLTETLIYIQNNVAKYYYLDNYYS